MINRVNRKLLVTMIAAAAVITLFIYLGSETGAIMGFFAIPIFLSLAAALMFKPIWWRCALAITASAAVIALDIFQLPLNETLTPFILGPLFFVAWSFFAGLLVAGLVTAISKFRLAGPVALSPLLIQVIVILLIIFAPLSDLWIRANFRSLKSQRENIVRKVYNGDLQPNVSHDPKQIALGDKYPSLSMGGNEILIETRKGKKYVLFFTDRGFLDSGYSGFVCVPKGGDFKLFRSWFDLPPTNILPLSGNWFHADFPYE